MNRPSIDVLTDDKITSRVLDILRDAKKHVALVSPYNKFWMHLSNEIQSTVGRGVRVDFVYREDERNEDIERLEGWGVEVHAVKNLHAKIYLNESSVLVTSMNLLESSSKNSMEICISIRDKNEQKDVREYVKTLLLIAKRADEGKKTSARPATSRAKTRKPQTVSEGRLGYKVGAPEPSLESLLNDLVVATSGGRCIRCEEPIPFDQDRPLCDDCFKSWKRYENWDYEEEFCHRCGADWDTSYAKPLCRPCYNQV